MRITIGLLMVVLALPSCDNKADKTGARPTSIPIVGTWKLLTETTIQNGDTITVDHTKNQEQIKIINETHFSFLGHDLSKGKDSTKIFSAGGGTYTLVNDKYTESLVYCNYREWEGGEFDFTVSIKNDTLIQQGLEKVKDANIDRQLIEKYVRVKQ
jgi:hypothetical protein